MSTKSKRKRKSGSHFSSRFRKFVESEHPRTVGGRFTDKAVKKARQNQSGLRGEDDETVDDLVGAPRSVKSGKKSSERAAESTGKEPSSDRPVPRTRQEPVLPGNPIKERLAAYTEGDRKIQAILALESESRSAVQTYRKADLNVSKITEQLDSTSDPAQKSPLTARYIDAIRERARSQAKFNESVAAARSKLHEIAAVSRPQEWEHTGPGVDHPRVGPLVKGSEDFLGPIFESHPEPKPVKTAWVANDKPGYRANFNRKNQEINMASSDDVGTAVHERGHHIEENFPEIAHQSRQFLEHRVGSQTLEQIYKGNNQEFGRPDKFKKFFGDKDKYVGKHYQGGNTRTTEILSMGLQALHDDPVRFAKQDPEYAKWVLGILDGSLR